MCQEAQKRLREWQVAREVRGGKDVIRGRMGYNVGTVG